MGIRIKLISILYMIDKKRIGRLGPSSWQGTELVFEKLPTHFIFLSFDEFENIYGYI